MSKLNFPKYKQLIEEGYSDEDIAGASGQDTSIFSGLYKQNFAPKPKEALKPAYSLFGANITPEEEQKYPYTSAIGKIAQEGFATPLAHAVNQTLFNLPRAGMYAMGYEYPEAESLPGQMLSKGAGAAGAFLGTPGKTLFKAGEGIVSKFAPKMAQSVGRSTLEGTIGGAVSGAAYTPTEDMLGLKQRAIQGAMGGALGGVAGTVSGIIGKLFSNKARQLEMLRGEAGATEETLGRLGKQGSEEVGNLQKSSKEQIDLLKAQREATEQTGLGEQNIFAKNISESKKRSAKAGELFARRSKVLGERYTNDITKAEGELMKLGEESSETLAKKLPEWKKNINKIYGDEYDRLIGDTAISKAEAIKLVKNTKASLRTKGLPIDDVVALEDSINKSSSDSIKIRDLDSYARSLKPSIGKMRSGKYGADDVSGFELHDNIMSTLGEASDEVRNMREAYRPVIEAYNELAGTSFQAQPGRLYGREPAVGKITGYAKDVTGAKTTPGSTISRGKVINVFEKGTKEYPGAEVDISSKPIAKAEEIVQKQKQKALVGQKYEGKTMKYKSEMEGKIAGIEEELSKSKNITKQRSDSISREISDYERQASEQIDSLKSTYKELADKKGQRAIELSRQIADMEKSIKRINGIKTAIKMAAITVGSGSAMTYGVRLGGRLLGSNK